jgi:hypothetical protein
MDVTVKRFGRTNISFRSFMALPTEAVPRALLRHPKEAGRIARICGATLR